MSHDHDHGRAGGSGKLNAVLPYLLKHNREHVEDLRKWLATSRDEGLDEVAGELEEIIVLSERVSERLQAAVEKLPA
jgi:hypothetical protein